ncbi:MULTISPECIES: class I SAM-dependent methyltransferase [Streptomyces]|uniref:Class I SAM-dependent methyltransferase n=1 Tax=Streptomyces ramulosus TaxID=47762 RepID=A0ABW1FIX0_9ACTN
MTRERERAETEETEERAEKAEMEETVRGESVAEDGLSGGAATDGPEPGAAAPGGPIPTAGGGPAFLRRFHAAHPAVTARAMAHGRAPDGRSSYALLRDAVAGRRRVLDVGCGDGLLLELLAAGPGRQVAGIDLSAAELALARRRPGLDAAVLHTGNADRLPFSTGEFDGVVSHMALMLMDRPERVAAEIARVLAPGGTLAAVLGGGPGEDEAYATFLRLLRPVLDAAPPGRRIPPLGDRRLRTREGFDAVFGPVGFAPVAWERVALDLTAPPDTVWRTVGCLYDLAPLHPAAVADLRTRFAAATAPTALPDGRIPCAMTVYVAVARRTG